MQEEIWKTIDGYPNYEASTFGRIRRVSRDYIDSWGRKYHLGEQMMKLYEQNQGNYTQVMVTIKADGNARRMIVSRIIATTFLQNPSNLPQVNHIDENPLNNHVDNLEWCTCKYNINYGDHISRTSKSKQKPIDVYDINNKYIETINSGKAASEKYGISRGIISMCCNNKIKSSHGYMFKFSNT